MYAYCVHALVPFKMRFPLWVSVKILYGFWVFPLRAPKSCSFWPPRLRLSLCHQRRSNVNSTMVVLNGPIRLLKERLIDKLLINLQVIYQSCMAHGRSWLHRLRCYGDLSYLASWTLGMINLIATYTSVYNLYLLPMISVSHVAWVDECTLAHFNHLTCTGCSSA